MSYLEAKISPKYSIFLSSMLKTFHHLGGIHIIDQRFTYQTDLIINYQKTDKTYVYIASKAPIRGFFEDGSYSEPTSS